MSEKSLAQFDLETIEKLADMVEKKHLGEITLADGEKIITVKGRKCLPLPAGMPVGMLPPAAVSVAAPGVETEPVPASVTCGAGTVIKSPIVGTYYSSASPDQPVFVRVGDTVKKGDVIMIIESMKLMNEVQSDVDGAVKEILVKNGDAVEYDQPLMIIA